MTTVSGKACVTKVNRRWSGSERSQLSVSSGLLQVPLIWNLVINQILLIFIL